MLMIQLSLKRMELLENRVTPFYSMRAVSQVSSQHWPCVHADAQCKWAPTRYWLRTIRCPLFSAFQRIQMQRQEWLKNVHSLQLFSLHLLNTETLTLFFSVVNLLGVLPPSACFGRVLVITNSYVCGTSISQYTPYHHNKNLHLGMQIRANINSTYRGWWWARS